MQPAGFPDFPGLVGVADDVLCRQLEAHVHLHLDQESTGLATKGELLAADHTLSLPRLVAIRDIGGEQSASHGQCRHQAGGGERRRTDQESPSFHGHPHQRAPHTPIYRGRQRKASEPRAAGPPGHPVGPRGLEILPLRNLYGAGQWG